MNEETLKKRIKETKFDTYPLDKLLPLQTVFAFFLEKYNQTAEKSIFFRDRLYQKMREGYAAIFVAISHQDTSGLDHLIFFPSDPGNDFYLVEVQGTNDFKATEFDVKEFTDFPRTFEDFLEKKILPKIDRYHMVIISYRDIGGSEIKLLADKLNEANSSRRVWLLSSPTPEDLKVSVAQVTVINRNGPEYHKVVNLDEWIDKGKTPMVYQDIVRLKKEV